MEDFPSLSAIAVHSTLLLSSQFLLVFLDFQCIPSRFNLSLMRVR